MKNILAPSYRGLLRRFAGSRVLLGFDYDGTLAPLAADPAKAQMRGTTRRLLTQAARLYPCAVISGRSHKSLSRVLDGIPVPHLIGNHGAEWVERAAAHDRYIRAASAWRELLESRLSDQPGIVLEDKAYSLAVHYRRARNRVRALHSIHTAIADLSGCRVIPGILAVNLVPVTAPGKGHALERLRRQLQCERTVFIGDDITDEDAFGVTSSFESLSIRVGRSSNSKAEYFLSDQKKIDELLGLFYQIRLEDQNGRRDWQAYADLS